MSSYFKRLLKILFIYFAVGIIWLLLTKFIFVPLGWGMFAMVLIGLVGFSIPIVFIIVLATGAKDYLQSSSQEKAQRAVSLQKYYIPQIIALLMGAIFLISGYFLKDFWQIGLGVFGLLMGIIGLFLRNRNMDVNKIAENYEKHKKRNNIIFILFLSLLLAAGSLEKVGLNFNLFSSFFRENKQNSTPLLTLDQLKNTMYYYDLDHRPLQGAIKLNNGAYNKTGSLISDQLDIQFSDKDVSFGDLNSDGIPDATVVLHENRGGSIKHTILAAILNRDGEPWLMDEVDMGSYDLGNIKLNNGTIELSGIERTAGYQGDVLKNADYQYKLIGNSLYGTDISHPLDSTQGTKKFTLIKGVDFDIPASFNLWEGAESIIEDGGLNFNKESTYPKTGVTMASGCLGNYKYPSFADTDKILRQRIAGAIEICIALRNGYLQQGRPFQRTDMQSDGYGMRETVSLEVRQTPENHYADIVDLTIRSADFSQGPQIENILVGILKSAKTDGKKLWPE